MPKTKSTSQPRPKLFVPPRGIGPVFEPNSNDVLCGRGGRINANVGNVQFRAIIAQRRKEYLAPSTKKLEKAHIAADIVWGIRAKVPPGRFLKEERDGGWWDIGDAKAIKKVGQALREEVPGVPDEKPGSEEDQHGDEEAAKAPPPKKSKADPEATAARVAAPVFSWPTPAATSVTSPQRSFGSQDSYTLVTVQPAPAPNQAFFVSANGSSVETVASGSQVSSGFFSLSRCFHVHRSWDETSAASGSSNGTTRAVLSGSCPQAASSDSVCALRNERIHHVSETTAGETGRGNARQERQGASPGTSQ